MSTTRSPSRSRYALLAGVAASIAGLGIGELVAAIVAPSSGMIVALGSFVIDLAPAWLKELVISLFGTGDKIVLIVSVGLLVLVLSAFAGWLEFRKPPWGRILLGVGALVGTVVAMSRAGSGNLALLPSLVTGLVGVLFLAFLIKRLRPDYDYRSIIPASDPPLDRRRFLVFAGSGAVVGMLAVLGGQFASAGRRTVEAVRTAFTLPKPSVAAPAIPAAASFDIAGLSPIVTPNSDFYRIDTALTVPVIDPNDWVLKVTGMVDREVSISYAELIAMPLEESTTTLMCVSNYVGGDLIGNATWLGYPLRELLAKAGPSADADMVLSTSIDGFTASTPIGALTDERNSILAVGMNGEALPLEHGYPVRMVVPGLYGYVSATKWVVQLEVTRFDQAAAYWTNRGWSAQGPIKISSRIDVPGSGGSVPAGDVVIAGVAWDQHIGIKGVQVRIDNGDWQDATLAKAISVDTWRQWMFTWSATSGNHTIAVRAISTDGEIQTADLADVVPDGATGLHTINVTVS